MEKETVLIKVNILFLAASKFSLLGRSPDEKSGSGFPFQSVITRNEAI